MVQVDAGDDGAIRLDDVDRVQPSAQADFENHHLQRAALHHVQNGQRGKFKVGQRDGLVVLHPGAFNACKGSHQFWCLDGITVEAQAFFKMHQMRRGIDPGAVAGLQQNGFQHDAGGALAVGAGHRDHRAIKTNAHALGHGMHALQAQINRDGM